MEDEPDNAPATESLLPYDAWTEAAMREVALRALEHAAAEGLPGEHHFYLTFRTDMPGTAVPARLLAQYPHEMTIVLQHQFWDLRVDRETRIASVGLSFGGVPSTLVIPFGAITAFADPHVQFGLRFRAEPPAAPEAPPPPPPGEPEVAPQVVSLDAFRRKKE